METRVSALKVGCGKFFHGRQRLRLLPSEIERLGGNALIVGGPESLRVFFEQAEELLKGSTYTRMTFESVCSVAAAEAIVQLAREKGCRVLVAVGGGKCIDCVKCASVLSSLPIITVPTSIATCAATSMVAIMYNEKGQRAPAIKLEKEIDVCIADTDLIRTAPPRTLAAGILDSMAKYPESIHQKSIATYADCLLEEYIQYVNAKAIFGLLLGEYRDMYERYEGYARWEDIILTNLLHTSIVSGFADGSGQLAVAHALYDFVRNHHTRPGEAYLHGELVAVGLLVQMAFNGQPAEEIEAVRAAMRTMGMPLSLKDIDFDRRPESVAFLLRNLASDAHITTDAEKDKLGLALGEIL